VELPFFEFHGEDFEVLKYLTDNMVHLLNHATIAWFSIYKKQRGGLSAALFE
jgi:hypothetical protein